VGYHVPFYAQGGSLDVFAGYSDVDAGSTQTTAGTLAFSGAGMVMGARYNRHLERIGSYEHRLVFGIDYRDYRNTCSLGTFGAAGCGTAAASFTLFPLSLTYTGNLSQANGQSSFYATVITNLPLNVDSDTTALGRARFEAKANYWIYRAGITYAHSFEGDWQGRVRFDGQYTEDVLTSPDQFGIGGANSVRGFLERERADDRGHSASFEVYTPDLAARLALSGWSMRVVGFYDVGRTRRVDPQPGEVVHNGIASFGAGLRVAYGKTFTLRTDLAHILDPGGTRERGHWRAGFAATVSF
jgi:hemolysin activation/secretion protein